MTPNTSRHCRSPRCVRWASCTVWLILKRCTTDRRAEGALSLRDADVPYTLGKGCCLKGQVDIKSIGGLSAVLRLQGYGMCRTPGYGSRNYNSRPSTVSVDDLVYRIRYATWPVCCRAGLLLRCWNIERLTPTSFPSGKPCTRPLKAAQMLPTSQHPRLQLYSRPEAVREAKNP